MYSILFNCEIFESFHNKKSKPFEESSLKNMSNAPIFKKKISGLRMTK